MQLAQILFIVVVLLDFQMVQYHNTWASSIIFRNVEIFVKSIFLFKKFSFFQRKNKEFFDRINIWKYI
jgi:hypothetical protein